ncbi:MAG: hypothetical protein ABIL09_00365 [Gemmatimonadota bacterium]
MYNDAAVQQRIRAFVRRLGALKGDGPMTTANTGTASYIAGTFFRGLIDDTVALSPWMKAGANIVEVDPGQESIQAQNFDDARWVGIAAGDEGDPTAFDATVRPTSREVLFQTQHHAMQLSITYQDQKKARARLGTDLRRQSEEGFARALGNNLARTWIRGDTTSADPSLNLVNGLRIRAAAQGRVTSLAQNVGGVLVARAFNPDLIFPQAAQAMPVGRRSNMLRWYAHPDLWLRYGEWLSNMGTVERVRDRVAEEAMSGQLTVKPQGYAPLQVPQWPADEGPQGAPDAVNDDGDGTITLRVNVVLPDINDYSGRRVRVTYLTNGQFEDLVVVQNALGPYAGLNSIETAGALGQPAAAIDVVAAHYRVEVIDETSVLLMNPRAALLLMDNVMLAFKKFDAIGLNFDTIVHAFIDCQLLQPDAVVLLTGFWLP